MRDSETLGRRLKLLRLRQGLTLDDVTGKAGCSRSMLSKIENGKAFPSLSTLANLALAVGCAPSSLMDSGEGVSTGAVFTPASSERGRRADAGYCFLALAEGRASKMMDPFVITASSKDVEAHALSHPGEEFIYVLEGEMEMRVGTVSYRLAPGDSLYFDAEEEHCLTPLEEVRYLLIHSYSHLKKTKKRKGNP